MTLTPYLNFNGNTLEVATFYAKILDGQIHGLVKFGDMSPDAQAEMQISEVTKEMVAHLDIFVDGTRVLMASDLPHQDNRIISGNNVFIHIILNDEQKAEQIFNSLAQEGKINMPFEEVFWGGKFGAVVDKFRIGWQISFEEKQPIS